MSPTLSPRTSSMVINMAINHSLGLTLPLLFPIGQLTLFTVKQSQDQSLFYLVSGHSETEQSGTRTCDESYGQNILALRHCQTMSNWRFM